ncbi:MAG: hypothetical protein WCO64_08430 [Actinomycetes bacterium]
MQWWFCLIHQDVEQGAGCPDASRLGPYDDQAQAHSVLERMALRTTIEEIDD